MSLGERLQGYKGQDPDFDVKRRSQEACQGELFRDCIVSILVDPPNDKVTFVSVQETPRLIRLVWKVHQQEISKEGAHASKLKAR